MLALAILGLTRGAFDRPGSMVATTFLGVTAIQVWKNPEACVPNLFRRGRFHRRSAMVEFVTTVQLGLVPFLLGFVIAHCVRGMISN